MLMMEALRTAVGIVGVVVVAFALVSALGWLLMILAGEDPRRPQEWDDWQ